ncbi:MAG: hypothetical protein O9341_23320 [Paucibacter sp.]|nr:hypothetical protein [Roseateles sp.]
MSSLPTSASSSPPPVLSSGPVPAAASRGQHWRDRWAQARWSNGTLVYGSSGLVLLFALLLLGDFAWSLKERAVTPVAQVLLKQMQASDVFIALVVGSVPAGLGLLLGPIVAVRSDRHRGRWGRRIPYLFLPRLSSSCPWWAWPSRPSSVRRCTACWAGLHPVSASAR